LDGAAGWQGIGRADDAVQDLHVAIQFFAGGGVSDGAEPGGGPDGGEGLGGGQVERGGGEPGALGFHGKIRDDEAGREGRDGAGFARAGGDCVVDASVGKGAGERGGGADHAHSGGSLRGGAGGFCGCRGESGAGAATGIYERGDGPAIGNGRGGLRA